MQTLEAQVKSSYYIRVIVIGLLTAGLGALLMLLQQRQWAQTFDNNGVTRRDGKDFWWMNLKDVRYVHVRGALNNIELIFDQGKALVFPLMLENSRDVMNFISHLPGEGQANNP
jgi:hypothetical protein